MHRLSTACRRRKTSRTGNELYVARLGNRAIFPEFYRPVYLLLTKSPVLNCEPETIFATAEPSSTSVTSISPIGLVILAYSRNKLLLGSESAVTAGPASDMGSLCLLRPLPLLQLPRAQEMGFYAETMLLVTYRRLSANEGSLGFHKVASDLVTTTSTQTLHVKDSAHDKALYGSWFSEDLALRVEFARCKNGQLQWSDSYR
jgi:hypothetical protein